MSALDRKALALSAWDRRTVGEWLEHWERLQPDRNFIKCASEWMSYREVEHATAVLAASLQRVGIGKGDSVALVAANSIQMVLSLLALARIGAIAVPLNTFLKGEFLRFQLADARAQTVICDSDGEASLARIAEELPAFRRLVRIEAGKPILAGAGIEVHNFDDLLGEGERAGLTPMDVADPMALLYTSGTTGMPKGCIVSQGYFLANPIACIEAGWFAPGDIMLTAFPLFHTAGYSIVLGGALQVGAAVCFEQQFSASRFISRAIEEKATTAYGVGPMASAILETPPSDNDRLHSLRLCTWPPLTPEKQVAFEERFGVNVLCSVYGQTEASPIALLDADRASSKRGSLGMPPSHMETAILDDEGVPVGPGEIGELVVRGRKAEVMYQGYWNRPDETAAAAGKAWHHTGDLVRQDDDGVLYFVDRKKDAMRRRGENVSSMELEQALLKHPKIAAVATHAVPSSLGEDDIKAVIVLKKGETTDPGELFGFFKTALPYCAVPRYVELADQLPLTATGRVMKDALRLRGIAGAWDFEALGLAVDRAERRG